MKLLFGENKRLTPQRDFILDFFDEGSMNFGLTFIYKKRRFLGKKSSLYKVENRFRLILKNCRQDDIYPLYDFCRKVSCSPYEKEYTLKHGKPLILSGAVEKYCRFVLRL